MNRIKYIPSKNRISIGALPTSFLESMSYYEGLEYLATKMNELISFFNNELEQDLKEYIEQEFNNMMIDTMYDAETETLTLYLTQEV